MFLRVDQWSSGRAVECDCPESSRGASPRRFESSLLREPRMKIVPMRGPSRLGRCALHYNTGMDGRPCGKGAVLLRLLGRKSLASSTLAPSASRSAVIGHGIGPGIQSAKTGWIGMAERSRAYVSDAFAHIPPWCNGSTRVFGTHSPGSKPGGGT